MAARGINKVILIGNLGADPEVRYTPGGSAVASVSLATSMSWRDKDSGETKERTEWHRVVFFNRLGEIVKEYLRKGSKIYVEGSLRTNKWQDKSGADRYTTEIIADNMQMLDGRQGQSGGGGNFSNFNQNNAAAADQADQYAPQPATVGADEGNGGGGGQGTYVEDDIPF